MREEVQSTTRIKPDNRDKLSGKFHKPPVNPSKLESANYLAKQKRRQPLLPIIETKRTPDTERRTKLSLSAVSPGVHVLQRKMSQMKEVLQEAGDTLEAVLRLVVPGHGQLRRKMETQKEYLAAFVISSLVIATVLAL